MHHCLIQANNRKWSMPQNSLSLVWHRSADTFNSDFHFKWDSFISTCDLFCANIINLFKFGGMTNFTLVYLNWSINILGEQLSASLSCESQFCHCNTVGESAQPLRAHMTPYNSKKWPHQPMPHYIDDRNWSKPFNAWW